jgi:translation initiation factor 1
MRLFEGTPFDIPPKCDRCSKLMSECTCTAAERARVAPEKQIASLRMEKRQKGKVVTVVRGLTAIANDLPALLKTLKNTCGAGGTVDDDTIELQGDHLIKIRTQLEKLGYRVK